MGCGVRNLTIIISEKVAIGAEGKVVAVDPDEEGLKIARERYSASNIEYIQLQADDQTFPSGQYDVVFCNTSVIATLDSQQRRSL